MATESERNRGAGAYSTPGVDQPFDHKLAQIITQNPVAIFKLKDIDPPSQLYITQSDRLLVSTMSSDPNVGTVTIQGRYMRAADAQTVPCAWPVVTPATRVASRAAFDVPEGYLISATPVGTGGTTKGRLFVQLALIRGQGLQGTGVAEIMAGYADRFHAPKYPTSGDVYQVDGAGWARGVTGTTPAAGADINEVVPTGARWRFKSGRFRLVTSATVANRSVKVILADLTGSPIAIVSFNLQQAASSTIDYTVGIGLNPINDANALVSTVALPDNLLFAGFAWKTLTTNIQVGDQYSFIEYAVEEWLEL